MSREGWWGSFNSRFEFSGFGWGVNCFFAPGGGPNRREKVPRPVRGYLREAIWSNSLPEGEVAKRPLPENDLNADSILQRGERLEELISSGYRIIQGRKGYRYSLDAVLLAHFVSSFPGRSALELGMGNGAASLLLAKRREDLKITGIEIQEGLASQAQRSVIINGLEGRIFVLAEDWRNVPSLFPPHSFDLVFANPPYRSVGSGRVSPRGEVSLAKHGPQGRLESLVKAAVWVLKAKGTLSLIYHANGLVPLMACVRQAHLEPKSLRLVHSFFGSEAEFALVSARKEGREGLKVLPPLILYSGKGNRPSPDLEAIYGSFRSAQEGNS